MKIGQELVGKKVVMISKTTYWSEGEEGIIIEYDGTPNQAYKIQFYTQDCNWWANLEDFKLVESTPKITIDDLKNKNMNVKIEVKGSTSLLEAFNKTTKEKIKQFVNIDFDYYQPNYLHYWDITTMGVSWCDSAMESEKHFNLPEEWNEALDAVKELYTPKPYEYKVGDIVKLPSIKPEEWNNKGEMDKYLDKTVKITEIYSKYNGVKCFRFNGSEDWYFLIDEIVELMPHDTKVDVFKELPEIDGYKGKLVTPEEVNYNSGQLVKYGCQLFPIHVITAIIEREISIDQIQEVYDALEEMDLI